MIRGERMLEIDDLVARYGSITALHGVSLSVERGAIVAVLGANGAGKSTLLRTVSGLVPGYQGSIRFEGSDIRSCRPYQIARLGISHVPEGRRIFPECTVLENLRLGAYVVTDRPVIEERIEEVFGLFPRLRERVRQQAGTLSGGEQQMLVIGRALMGRPRLLMLDEPSLGLAPLVVDMLFERIVAINSSGITVVLVEQNVHLALEIARYAFVLRSGRLVAHGAPAELTTVAVESLYLARGD
jgi:branched-chain amino acid transport system ATP-binding protein